jgi:hypothetical protein
MWLLRCAPRHGTRRASAAHAVAHSGLDFTAKALRRSVNNKQEELSVSFTQAYEASLRQFHSFVVRPIFAVRRSHSARLARRRAATQVAMKACPYRATFYEKLTGSGDRAQTEADLEKWLASLETIVAKLQGFLKSGDYTKGF